MQVVSGDVTLLLDHITKEGLGERNLLTGGHPFRDHSTSDLCLLNTAS